MMKFSRVDAGNWFTERPEAELGESPVEEGDMAERRASWRMGFECDCRDWNKMADVYTRSSYRALPFMSLAKSHFKSEYNPR